MGMRRGVVLCQLALAMRVDTRPGSAVPSRYGSAGVDLDIQQGKPTGALAPWPVIGATCSGPVRQVPDPPVNSGGTPPTFASPRNRMGGRIRPPSVVTGFLEGVSTGAPTRRRPRGRRTDIQRLGRLLDLPHVSTGAVYPRSGRPLNLAGVILQSLSLGRWICGRRFLAVLRIGNRTIPQSRCL